VVSRERAVNYANLAPGKYTFEVQGQNENLEWGASGFASFTIRPAWWQTWTFRILVVTLVIAVVYYYYKKRIKVIRQEVEIQTKIRDLESAALRAQMNPHFIFNCLNSIQDFIGSNDAASATAYLGKFARLVRLALHSSVDGLHSLREEIEMLENYLALEQLRFKGRFEYKIHVSPEINTDEISLPPILIQPFVENAIVHGMKNKKGDGKIEVTFSKNGNTLIVTVADNGTGITISHQPITDTGHKSVGMRLTQRRLGMLSGQENERVVSHENLTDVHGVVIGSIVRVEIPVE
jgi:sensor histidine kinase YesM